MKKIPYGITDFERIVRENYYYFDHSEYIKKVEDRNSFIMLLRPRRMGKSLFSNMMMAYYDLAKKDQFHELFGNLWIGQHPTEFASKFVVLRFDFSKVDCKDVDELPDAFRSYCLFQFKFLFDYYGELYSEEDKQFVLSAPSAKDAVNAFINASKVKGYRTYLFIDEYDNFTNTVLAAHGEGAHRAITHGEGFYRNFFKAFKDSFDRIFMTGVSPVTYDDLTSGFSIADNISLDFRFNQIVGVTETELRGMIDYYRSEGQLVRTTDEIVDEMRPWYNNFCFAERSYGKDDTMYNPNMVIRYMNNVIGSDETPHVMIDRDARTDYDKLDYLITKSGLESRDYRIEILHNICANGFIKGDIVPEFPASTVGEMRNFRSMLYYLGTLTFGGRNDYGEVILKVPNRNMGDLYLNYMLKVAQDEGLKMTDRKYEHLMEVIRDAAVMGNWEPMIQDVGKLYTDYSSIRDAGHSEADIQGFIRGLLCLNGYFAVWPELELGKGYTDVLLVPKADTNSRTRHSYVIEIKYLKTDDRDIDAKVAEAIDQLNKYASETRLYETNLLRGTQLRRIYLVFQGCDLVKYGMS